jgi:hypothetical protein
VPTYWQLLSSSLSFGNCFDFAAAFLAAQRFFNPSTTAALALLADAFLLGWCRCW